MGSSALLKLQHMPRCGPQFQTALDRHGLQVRCTFENDLKPHNLGTGLLSVACAMIGRDV